MGSPHGVAGRQRWIVVRVHLGFTVPVVDRLELGILAIRECCSFLRRERPVVEAHILHVAFVGAAEVVVGLSHLEDETAPVLRAEVLPFGVQFTVHVDACKAPVTGQHHAVPVAVVPSTPADQRAHPADVVDQASTAQEEGLGIRCPLACGRALRDQRAARATAEASTHGEGLPAPIALRRIGCVGHVARTTSPLGGAGRRSQKTVDRSL